MNRVLVATVALSLVGAGFLACGADDDHPPSAAACVDPACETVLPTDPPQGQGAPSPPSGPGADDESEGEPPEPIGGAGVVGGDAGAAGGADADPFFGNVDQPPIGSTPVVPGGNAAPTTPVNPSQPNPNPADAGPRDTGTFVVPIPI